MLTKIGNKLNKITNIMTKLNIKHLLWHVERCWIDTWTFKKKAMKWQVVVTVH